MHRQVGLLQWLATEKGATHSWRMMKPCVRFYSQLTATPLLRDMVYDALEAGDGDIIQNRPFLCLLLTAHEPEARIALIEQEEEDEDMVDEESAPPSPCIGASERSEARRLALAFPIAARPRVRNLEGLTAHQEERLFAPRKTRSMTRNDPGRMLFVLV